MTTPNNMRIPAKQIDENYANTIVSPGSFDITNMPDEVVLHILFYMTARELLLSCALVSKHFQSLAYCERLWWHHIFALNQHYKREWTAEGEPVGFSSMLTPITPGLRTPSTCGSAYGSAMSSRSLSRMTWKKDRYVYEVGLDERFDRIYSFYENDKNATHVLNPRHYFLESCLVQESATDGDYARDGINDQARAQVGKNGSGTNGYLDRNMTLEVKISKSGKAPFKRHRLTMTSVLAPSQSVSSPLLPSSDRFNFNTPTTPTTPTLCQSPSTPQSPLMYISNEYIKPFNQLVANAFNNIRGKQQVNFNHRSICVIGGYSERVQTDSREEVGINMFDCGKQAFRSKNMVDGFVKSDKPNLYGKHSAVLFDEDETRGIQGRIFLFGGSDGTQVLDDLYIYDLDRRTFLKTETFGDQKPAPRVNHCACRVGENHMYLLGGGVGKDMVPSDEVWILNTDTLHWTLVDQANNDVFTPRLGFTVTSINDKILLHGGAYWVQNRHEARWREAYKQTMLFDTKTCWWTLLKTTGCGPDVGSFPTSCLIGTQWFFISGATENNVTEDIYCFDTVLYRWRHMKEKGYHADGLSCCPYTHYGPNRQQKILVFGGYRYQPLEKVCVLNVKWVDIMVKNGIMPLKQQNDKPTEIPGIVTPVDHHHDVEMTFGYP
ncbi:hypothetical protein AKO1_005893 [Acrasis kona]|uniref:F-box domain-containing protein n=1 Tax=Acrasis kona TaxID=1008807 RepID=A0AAW2YIZ5_9EUKA